MRSRVAQKPDEPDGSPPAPLGNPLPPASRGGIPDSSGDPLLQTLMPPRGLSTLGALLRSVTDAAVGGLRLEASPEIAEHALALNAAGMRASSVMEALAALGDWEWVKREDGSHILRVAEAPMRGTLSPDARSRGRSHATWQPTCACGTRGASPGGPSSSRRCAVPATSDEPPGPRCWRYAAARCAPVSASRGPGSAARSARTWWRWW